MLKFKLVDLYVVNIFEGSRISGSVPMIIQKWPKTPFFRVSIPICSKTIRDKQLLNPDSCSALVTVVIVFRDNEITCDTRVSTKLK